MNSITHIAMAPSKYRFYDHAYLVKGRHGTAAQVTAYLRLAEKFGVFDRRGR